MLENRIAAALSDCCRASETRTRAIKMICQIDFKGGIFSFFTKLHPEQERRAIALFLKAGIIELARDAIRDKLKAGYTLTAAYRPIQPEIHESRFEEIDAEIAEWEESNKEELTVGDMMKMWGEEWTEEDEAEFIESEKLEAEEFEAELKEFAATQVLLTKVTTRSKSAEEVLFALQSGSKSYAQLAKISTSTASMNRALRQLKQANLISVEGAGQSTRTYSLVK